MGLIKILQLSVTNDISLPALVSKKNAEHQSGKSPMNATKIFNPGSQHNVNINPLRLSLKLT